MSGVTVIFLVVFELLRCGTCCRKYVPDVDSEEIENPGLLASLQSLPFFLNRPVTNYIKHQKNVEPKCTCGTTNPNPSATPTPRVYGGSEAGNHEFPFQASLAVKNTRVSICGGTLINSHFVLTAAHCVIDIQGGVAFYAIKKLRSLQILLRAHNLNIRDEANATLNFGKRKSEREIQAADAVDNVLRLNIAEVIIHPGYTYSLSTYQKKQIEDDIALIRLEKGVSLTGPSIWTSCLPMTDNYELYPDVMGLIIGWGLTRFEDNLSYAQSLRKLEIPIQNLDFCRFGGFSISHHFICISSGTREKDAGVGDSGGPLLVKNPTSTRLQYIQVGIASYQNTVFSASSKGYSVYTRVSEYLPWIYSQTDREARKGTLIKWCKTE